MVAAVVRSDADPTAEWLARQITEAFPWTSAPTYLVRVGLLALGKDAPLGRRVQRSGVIVAIPILSGLHHHYVRI
jgi:hypothetical protein